MDKTSQQKLDYALLFILFLMAIVSIISIYSALPTIPDNLVQKTNFVNRQIMWYGIGIFVIAVTMILDYDRLQQIAWYLYGFGILLLLGLTASKYAFHFSFAPKIKGAWGWYVVPGVGNFQPAELMKIFMIIVYSRVIFNHRNKYENPTIQEDFILLGKIVLTLLPPLFLLMTQPDMGMIMVFCAITATLVLVSGIRWRIIFSFTGIAILAIVLVVFIFFNFPDFFHKYLLEDYQLDRFYGWLDPYGHATEQGFQLTKSLLSVGYGGLYGSGFQELKVFIPEAYTDFIFALISQQFGFVGASIVVILFFFLVYRMIHTALESHDIFGSFLCAGVIGMISFQVFQNIGMTIGLLPITGLPLPFISYGGSSLATYMLAIGIVLNVRSRTKKFMFGSDDK